MLWPHVYSIKVPIFIPTKWFDCVISTTSIFIIEQNPQFFLGVDKSGQGLLYRNFIDCFVKTYTIEGMRGLYKGFVANYYRCAPHTILNLTFWELFKEWKNIYLSDEANMYFE